MEAGIAVGYARLAFTILSTFLLPHVFTGDDGGCSAEADEG